MKHVRIWCVSNLLLLFIAAMQMSCKPSGGEPVGELGSEIQLTKADTVVVIKLFHEYMDRVVEGKTDSAINMLYVWESDSTLTPLPREMEMGQRMALQMYTIADYELRSVKFDGSNNCRIDYEMFLSEALQTGQRAGVSCTIFSARTEYGWVLTVADSFARLKVSAKAKALPVDDV